MVENTLMLNMVNIFLTMTTFTSFLNPSFQKAMVLQNYLKRSLHNIAQCFFFQSHHPKNLWSKAMKASCYPLSRHLTKSLKNQAHEEAYI